MKEIFVMLAKAMSQDQVINRLEEAINLYKEAKLIGGDIEAALGNLKMSTHLFIMNSMEQSPMDIIKDMETIDKRMKLFETDSN
jgi:hypothetical protein